MRSDFKNPIAFKLFNLAMEVEKIAKETRKEKSIQKLQIRAGLQMRLENRLEEMSSDINRLYQELREK